MHVGPDVGREKEGEKEGGGEDERKEGTKRGSTAPARHAVVKFRMKILTLDQKN